MIKNLLLTSLLCLAAEAVVAQAKEDVLYLKNRNVVRGDILERTDSMVAIRTADGSIYHYETAGIDSVTREKLFRSFMYKRSGFAHFTELGTLIAGKTTIDGVTTAAFSFQTVNGYKFSQYAMLGGGVGADLYATQTIVPLFVTFRGDLGNRGSAIPFYFVDAGYGVNITQESANAENFKGGLLYAAGFGLKIPFNKTAGFMLSLGYRYQTTAYEANGTSTEVDYKRLALRAGFFL